MYTNTAHYGQKCFASFSLIIYVVVSMYRGFSINVVSTNLIFQFYVNEVVFCLINMVQVLRPLTLPPRDEQVVKSKFSNMYEI